MKGERFIFCKIVKYKRDPITQNNTIYLLYCFNDKNIYAGTLRNKYLMHVNLYKPSETDARTQQ
ncbi:hypothetical protein K090096B2_01290 [Bacteroides fragilis]